MEGTLTLGLLTSAYLATGLALHGIAHYFLRYLEQDD
jgi:hypothetical protein